MAYPEYNTKFVDVSEHPKIGTQCPACQKGYIENNDYKGKDGTQWYSVACKTCFTKWTSKYPPKDPNAPQKPDLGAKTGEEMGALRQIYTKLLEIEKALKELEKKSVIYPNDKE